MTYLHSHMRLNEMQKKLRRTTLRFKTIFDLNLMKYMPVGIQGVLSIQEREQRDGGVWKREALCKFTNVS